MQNAIRILVAIAATAVAGAACGPKTVDATGGGGTGGIMPFAGTLGTGATGGSGSSTAFDPCKAKPCEDFPAAPLSDGAPANAAQLFGPKDAGTPGTGPCLVEPEPGTLMPANWIRPRFRWMPMAGQTLFELRIHSNREKNDLRRAHDEHDVDDAAERVGDAAEPPARLDAEHHGARSTGRRAAHRRSPAPRT